MPWFEMDAAERKDILNRYLEHSRTFDEVAARRESAGQTAEVIQFSTPMRELEQEPTNREIEVLQLISEGLSAPDIGKRIHLSPTTVKSHLHKLYEKLGVSDRAAAVAEAMRRGLLE
jgi:two-component system nitrate/nitrite response regulator NarL